MKANYGRLRMGKMQRMRGGRNLKYKVMLRKRSWAHSTLRLTLIEQETPFGKSQNSQGFEIRWHWKQNGNPFLSLSTSQWAEMKDDTDSQKESTHRHWSKTPCLRSSPNSIRRETHLAILSSTSCPDHWVSHGGDRKQHRVKVKSTSSWTNGL